LRRTQIIYHKNRISGGDHHGASGYMTPDEVPDLLIKPASGHEDINMEMPLGKSLKGIKQAMIMCNLQENDGNRTCTAESLGISRRTLQLKLKEYGIN